MRRPEQRSNAALLATLLLALAGCASSPPPSAKRGAAAESAVVQRSINAAQGLLDQGDAAGAVAQAELAVRADPRSALAHLARAQALEALGRSEEAGRDLQRAYGLAPASGTVLNAYGVWLCRNGDAKQAMQRFIDALADERYTRPAQALANAGSCAASAGWQEQAELNFRAALGLAPEDAQSLMGMAKLEHGRGDHLRARAFLQRREALAPLMAAELMLAIEIETAAGDPRAAQRYRDQLAALGVAPGRTSTSDQGSSRQ
jgi:type IV pilus assembly protein PilF